MTKKDFELIASIIKNTYKNDKLNDIHNRIRIAKSFCNYLYMKYDRFDSYKFLKACGLEDSEMF